ncbi:hypothetical protein ACBQ54_18000 [Providencia vermicola]|uniref:hypothetical protein n=1 Tax=Providencia vermicola TaxID=333965 RepID=UPI0035242B99
MKMKFVSIALGLSVMLSASAWSANYTVYPGSMMKLTNIQGILAGGTGTTITSSTYGNPRAAGGGFTFKSDDATCNPATTVNGYTGLRVISSEDIIIGATGRSSGAIANIADTSIAVSNQTNLYPVDGTWDTYGKLSSTTASSHSISYNCLYPKNAPTGYIYYGGANRSAIGTKAATLNLSIWAYIGPNVPYGTYTPRAVYFVQGVSNGTQALIASRAIIGATDRIIVAPPPCSISVSNSSINFGTRLSETVLDALSINCNASPVTAAVYVKATAIQGTPTSDGYGLGLINTETNESNVDGTGIIVRGSIGPTASENCANGDPNSAILFDPNSMLPGYFVTNLSPAGNTNNILLGWYLCTTNRTVPGDYSGSVTLGITYR